MTVRVENSPPAACLLPTLCSGTEPLSPTLTDRHLVAWCAVSARLCSAAAACGGITAAPSDPAVEQCQKRFTEIIAPSRSSVTIRIINAAMLVYMTVCIEKHNVTVVALDAAPVAPKTFYECVDVNAGQR